MSISFYASRTMDQRRAVLENGKRQPSIYYSHLLVIVRVTVNTCSIYASVKCDRNVAILVLIQSEL